MAIYTSSIIHANGAVWTEVKLREIVRERRGGGDGADLAWLWLNSAQTPVTYTWVPLFIWIRILPLNIKHQKPENLPPVFLRDKVELLQTQTRFYFFSCFFFPKVLPCARRQCPPTWLYAEQRGRERRKVNGNKQKSDTWGSHSVKKKNILVVRTIMQKCVCFPLRQAETWLLMHVKWSREE